MIHFSFKKFGELWEDFYDNLIAEQRSNEPRVSLNSLKERLKKQGKLHV